MTSIASTITLPAPACCWPLSLGDMALLSLLTYPQNATLTLSGTFYWSFPGYLCQQPHSPSAREHLLCNESTTVPSMLCSLVLAKSPEQGSSNTEGSQNLVRHSFMPAHTYFFFFLTGQMPVTKVTWL